MGVVYYQRWVGRICINNSGCCGFKVIDSFYDAPINHFSKWVENFEDWFIEKYYNYDEDKPYNSYDNRGKMCQLILSASQWTEDHHKVLEENGWKLTSAWRNDSGSVCRAYQICMNNSELGDFKDTYDED